MAAQKKKKKKKSTTKLKVAAVRRVSRRTIKLKPPHVEPKKNYNRKVKHKTAAAEQD